jgi:predicted metal-dependent hydrolase
MTDLVVRRLLIDLHAPFERHWAGGDAFRSAFFDALSMSFPVGEQFFIDAVRAGVQRLPPAERTRLDTEVRGFIGQEATHRRIHALFNGHLEGQGYDNAWERRTLRRIARLQGVDVRHPVAVTAAIEHFTAILAEWILSHPEALVGAEPRLRTLWSWHAAEEAEHRSTAFDLYRALGGNQRWRLRWFRLITFHFLTDALRQTLSNLRRDGMLWRWNTWRSGARFLFGRGGLVRETYRPWRAYKRRDFHPRQHGSERGAQWLRENSAQFTEVQR